MDKKYLLPLLAILVSGCGCWDWDNKNYMMKDGSEYRLQQSRTEPIKRYYLGKEEVIIIPFSKGSYGSATNQNDGPPYEFSILFEHGKSNIDKHVTIFKADVISNLMTEHELEPGSNFPILIEQSPLYYYENESKRPEIYETSISYTFSNNLNLDWDKKEEIEISLKAEVFEADSSFIDSVILPMVPVRDKGGDCGTFD